eukprot:gene18569-25078_t
MKAPGGPANQVWDGRMLDAQEGPKRKEENAHHAVVKGNAPKARALPGKGAEERNTMTPPKVSGVSLAPVQDFDSSYERHRLAHQQQEPISNVRMSKKPSPLKLDYAGADGQKAGLNLWAQGKALQRAQAAKAASAGSHDEDNPNMNYYHEINDNYSPCTTPPGLSMDAVTRCDRLLGPLGPISPTPLSPSILTICGELGQFDLAHASPLGPSEDDTSKSQRAASPAWGSFGDLPDMRKCESPQIPIH